MPLLRVWLAGTADPTLAEGTRESWGQEWVSAASSAHALHHLRAQGWVSVTPHTGTKLRSSEEPPQAVNSMETNHPVQAVSTLGQSTSEPGAAAMCLFSRYRCDGEDAHQKLCDSSASPLPCEEGRGLDGERSPTGSSPLALVCTCPWFAGTSALPFRDSSLVALLSLTQRCYAWLKSQTPHGSFAC